MGVPFEALLPYGIIIGMFGVTGYGLHYVKRFANDGKKARWNRDLWDRVSHSFKVSYNRTNNRNDSKPLKEPCQADNSRTVMERDQRITGAFRAQSSNHQAPPDSTSATRGRYDITGNSIFWNPLTRPTDGEADLLDSKLQPRFPVTLYACAFFSS
ncbi:uncharacterized protein N7511_005797, partial [Penicillium nucicola]|uniref:uncharacterized protein n=1 Tax=Penicillium nucicola TaxID=1850975 RepID=UPI00254511CF